MHYIKLKQIDAIVLDQQRASLTCIGIYCFEGKATTFPTGFARLNRQDSTKLNLSSDINHALNLIKFTKESTDWCFTCYTVLLNCLLNWNILLESGRRFVRAPLAAMSLFSAKQPFKL